MRASEAKRRAMSDELERSEGQPITCPTHGVPTERSESGLSLDGAVGRGAGGAQSIAPRRRQPTNRRAPSAEAIADTHEADTGNSRLVFSSEFCRDF